MITAIIKDDITTTTFEERKIFRSSVMVHIMVHFLC